MLGSSHGRIRFATTTTFALMVCLLLFVSGASASAPAPGVGWEVVSGAEPTNLPPGGEGRIYIDVFNIGAASSSGGVTVTDMLPKGLTATKAGRLVGTVITENENWHCEGTSVVTCTIGQGRVPNSVLAGGGGGEPIPQIGIAVHVSPTASNTEVNHVTVAGGGAKTPASTTATLTVNSEPAAFGIAGWDAWFSNADGTIDTQAGSHPYAGTFSINLNDVIVGNNGKLEGAELPPSGGEPRNIEVQLPPGLVGNPLALPQCTRSRFDQGLCPANTQIGNALVMSGSWLGLSAKVFNVEPLPGVPSTLAFQIGNNIGVINGYPRSGSDYGITAFSENVPERTLSTIFVTIWGVPGDPSHNPWREESLNGLSLTPFFTLPTSCPATPAKFHIRLNSWQHPNVYAEATSYWHDSNGIPTDFTGCEHLSFATSITTALDTAKADTPSGLAVEVRPSTSGLLDPEDVSSADIKDTTVTLPEGMVINPGQAAGLQACQPSEDGLTTEAEEAEGKEDNLPAKCPNASKVGTDEVETPLLAKAISGGVYILPGDPPNIKLLITATGEGVVLKLPGTVHLNEATGQLTTTFTETPSLPFTNFRLAFSGGAQAALATPTHCGTYTTTSDFTPWSSPFDADVFPSSGFQITSGTAGAPCPPAVLPFTPNLIAGSTTDQAGGYTSFSMLLQSADDQQRIARLQFKTPEGLLGMISKVPLCGEPQAATGTCSVASQIGHTVVASGPGPYPLVIPEPGQPAAPIYLTGGYKGAPYGLSIVVPIHVGPFVLPTQIVRARIEVDPLTSQLTVTTDPLPQVVGGVPTDLRTVDAVVDRPEFMFNPTNCAAMSFSGTAWGTPPPGAGGPESIAPIASHFQMGSCQSLTFKPDLKVATSGKNSRKNGAGLDVKLVYPIVPVGHNQASGQANIAQVKVDLPKQLPSRLTTLQKACTAATFETNPAACPSESRVGNVTAITPVLPVPLTGPAIFVSNAGLKFPELVFVLQGYGVTVYVHAETFISKAGITSSTIRKVPDVPISSFELKLPQGPYSALAANGNLCKAKLVMPTAFVGQNGASLHQSTPITVTGCPKTAKKAKVKKANKRTKGKKRK